MATQEDVIALSSVANSANRRSQNFNPIWTADGICYQVFTDNQTAEVQWSKSTNGGITWTNPEAITASRSIGSVAVWFDKWTPGDTGTVIHIAYFEVAGNHDGYYRALDTATDTLGTEAVFFAGASLLNSADTCLSITKTRAGRIVIGMDGDGGTETVFTKSDDYPVTAFTAKTDFQEGTSDYFILLPGNYADSNDVDCIYWDRSADEITLKTYDDSANNWTGVSAETSIAASMVDISSTTGGPQFSAAVRNSDGHAILLAWNAADTLNADLRCFDINGAASITEKTNVVQNSTDDQGLCALAIDSANDDLYAFYAGKSDGSETFATALNVYYKVSTDDGGTWGSETLLSDHVRAVTQLGASKEFTGTGQFWAVWFAIEINANVTGYISAVVPEAGGGGGGQRVIGG
jgi:hypothetical protein